MGGRSVFERAQQWLSENSSGSRGKVRPRAVPGRHTRKCNVCRHPDRDAIEQEFLRWRSPEAIPRDHHIAHHSAIYRHAHSTGLFARRGATLRLALEPLIEQTFSVEATADAIVRAVCVYTHINDAGQWIETPKTHIVSRSNGAEPQRNQPVSASPLSGGPASPIAGGMESNRELGILEHGPTR